MASETRHPTLTALEDESQQNNGALLSLLEIGRELTAQQDLSSLWDLIMRRVNQLLDAERSTLYLVEPSTAEIYTIKMEGNTFLKIRLQVGHGIAGIVAQTGETINIPDVYLDPRWSGRAIDKQLGVRTRSMLCMPLRDRQHDIIGAIQVMNHRDRPFDATSEAMLAALCSFAAIALENTRLYESLRRTFDSFVQALTVAIDARDRSTAGHSERVATYCLFIGVEMGLTDGELELLRHTATLHDIGKIGVPEAILTKPERLTDAETEVMRRHVLESERILRNVEFARGLEDIPACVGQHHERVDGTGYPNGLKGEEISLSARILHVADVFDALSSRRHYREPDPPTVALEAIKHGAGSDFDSKVVAAFMRAWPAIEARWTQYATQGQ